MLYYLDKMKGKHYERRIRIEDVLFWILILVSTAIIIWKLFGSPTDLATIISVGTFLITSEILLWKYVLKIDKNTSMEFMRVKNSFLRVKHEIEKFRIDVDHRFDIIENKLDNLIKK